jgi:hypothetical protein
MLPNGQRPRSCRDSTADHWHGWNTATGTHHELGEGFLMPQWSNDTLYAVAVAEAVMGGIRLIAICFW